MTQEVQQTPSPLPPAGWYPNPHGQMQWWDGYRWGAFAPMPQAAPRTNAFAITALVCAILTIPPFLVSFLTQGVWVSLVLGLVPAMLAIVFGCLGIARSKITGAGRQMATAGLVIAICTMGLPILLATPWL